MAITAEDFDGWMRPKEALELLCQAFDHATAIDTVKRRLRGGLVQAVARNTSFEPKGKQSVLSELVRIPTKYWDAAPSGTAWTQFWVVGDARFFLGHEQGYAPSVYVSFFDVRFEPSGIFELVPEQPSGEIEEQDASPSKTAAPKGPPVSDAHLLLWYDVYREVYIGATDTLANAQASATGMFPGKFVSRDRVRNLCSGRKRGRKSKSDDGSAN
jgi:hypothetical protein